MNNDIKMTINEILDLKKRLEYQEFVRFSSQTHVKIFNEADLYFAPIDSVNSFLLTDNAFVPMKFECFNPGSDFVTVENLHFYLENRHEIAFISDHDFPITINWKDGVKTITCQLLRPPLPPGNYRGIVAIQTNLNRLTKTIDFEMSLKMSKLLSNIDLVFPKSIVVLPSVMLKILKGDTRIGTIVLLNPSSKGKKFSITSDSKNIIARPKTGHVKSYCSAYVHLIASSPQDIYPGGSATLNINLETYKKMVKETIQIFY